MIKDFLVKLSKNNFREVNTIKGVEIQIKCPICGEQMIDDGSSIIFCRDFHCNYCIPKKNIKRVDEVLKAKGYTDKELLEMNFKKKFEISMSICGYEKEVA